MKPCLIIFDIDETLYNNEERCLPESAITAIEKLKEAGHTLAVATGRALFELIEEITVLPIDFFILANGQLVVKDENIIYDNAIDPEIVKEIMKEAQSASVHLGFNSATHSSVTGLTDQMRLAFEKYYTTLPEISTCIKNHGSIYQIWYLSEDIHEVSEKFKDKLRFLPWLTNGADVIPVGASKAIGLMKTLEILGETLPEKIIFFGDGINDIELVEMADIGIAMGNAVEPLKAVADFVTTDITENGIYNACEQLGLFKGGSSQIDDVKAEIEKLKAEIATHTASLQTYFHLKDLYTGYLRTPVKALQVLEDALTHYSNDEVLLLELATLCEFELEDDSKAKSYYEQVLQLNPRHELARKALHLLNEPSIRPV